METIKERHEKVFLSKKAFLIALLILVVLFDWLPFYIVASFHGWKNGGLKNYQIDGAAEGYIQNRNLAGCSYEQCWTPLLYTSPARPRLKFVEFEIKSFNLNEPKEMWQRRADSLGIPAEGNGWYRVQLEKRPFNDCPLLLKKHKRLSRYVVRDGNEAYKREVKLLTIFGERKICPYVRKVDMPKSRYSEGDVTDSVLYRDGVHMIFKTDFRNGIDRITGQPLYQYVRYTGGGNWLQPYWRGPSDGCGDLCPSFVAPAVRSNQLPGNTIFDLLGFKNYSMHIDDIKVEEK